MEEAHGKRWTEAEIALLKERAAQGYSTAQIHAMFPERTLVAVQCAIRRAGFKRRSEKLTVESATAIAEAIIERIEMGMTEKDAKEAVAALTERSGRNIEHVFTWASGGTVPKKHNANSIFDSHAPNHLIRRMQAALGWLTNARHDARNQIALPVESEAKQEALADGMADLLRQLTETVADLRQEVQEVKKMQRCLCSEWGIKAEETE